MQILFGFVVEDMSALATTIASVLGIEARLHESSFRGGDYWRFGDIAALQRNEDGDELAEDAFPGYPVLLYVETDDKDEVVARFETTRPAPKLLRIEKLSAP